MEGQLLATKNESLEDYLEVGVPVILELDPRHRNSGRYRTAFRGWRADSYILLDLPPSDTLKANLWRGQDCIIRFVANGAACGCPCMVSEWSLNRTFAYVRTTWPTTFERQQIRQHERVQVMSACSIATSGDIKAKGVLRDLSAGGCCLDVPLKEPPERGDVIRLGFELPDGTAFDELAAEVRSVTPLSGELRLGCQFTDVSTELRQDLEFYVSAIVNRMRGDNAGSPDKRILIIEPYPEVVQRLCKRLHDESFAVHVERSVVEACYRLKANRPDVILVNAECDVDSQVLCRQIRQTKGMEKTPLFVYVDKVTQEEVDAEPLKSAGATDYCPLESDPGDVVKRIIASVGA